VAFQKSVLMISLLPLLKFFTSFYRFDNAELVSFYLNL